MCLVQLVTVCSTCVVELADCSHVVKKRRVGDKLAYTDRHMVTSMSLMLFVCCSASLAAFAALHRLVHDLATLVSSHCAYWCYVGEASV